MTRSRRGLTLAGLVTLTLLGCGAQADAESAGTGGNRPTLGGGGGSLEGGAAGSDGLGQGGSPAPAAGAGGSGTAGNGESFAGMGGFGGLGGGGEAGSTQDGDAGAGPTSVSVVDCAGAYSAGAPWPGAGRCADRTGRRREPGPQKLLSVRSVSADAPVTTTPIVGSDHVFVATENGVLRFNRDLDVASKTIRLKGNFASSPVLGGGRVYAISRDGKLHFASQEGPEPEQTLDLELPNDEKVDPSAVWASPPLLGKNALYVASPFGDIVRVQLGETPQLLGRITTPGSAAGGAVTLDADGSVYLPTTLGVVRVEADGSKLALFPSGPVATTPIAAGMNVLFADITGLLHRVVVPATTKEPIKSFAGAKLPEGPGPSAYAGDDRFVIASASSLQLLTLNDTSDLAGPVIDAPKGEAFYTTSATVYAAPAIDAAGRQYLASSDGTLYVLDQGGTLIDSYLTEGALLSQPALASGALYLGSTDKNVYVFTDSPPPTSGGNGGAGGAAGSGGLSGAAGKGLGGAGSDGGSL